ncbi:LysR family transcriptional regulator [Paraburkholderia sp.]|uniref:LysR family transcriptional regulator n=1 Tax=Paraburkholderia sp. TaxID=1926495 RepID=UPI003D6EA4D3
MTNLRRLDLNLLVTLDALLEERNVTRAAQRLNYSQPSVSVQLAKLRETFSDPLLLPGPRGMTPTARALELREPLRQALDELERAVLPVAPFDPATAQDTWRVAATDNAEQAILLPLLARLRALAPNTRLAVIQAEPPRLGKQAQTGAIDLGFHTTDEIPEGLRYRPLFREHYVLVGRTGHPRLKRRPTLAQFCKLEHVIASPDGGGFRGITDTVLERAGLQRRVVLSVPHFLFVLSAVANTDLVAMLPSRLVRGVPGLKTFDLAVEIPGYEMAMFWHERSHRDPGHQWLRERIVETV